MSSINKVILIGNVGKDPEIKDLGNGKRVANISVATSETWKDKTSGEKRERTEWHRVAVFNENLVNLIENYVSKGSKLYLEGKLQTREYEKDGQKHYSTEIALQGFDGQLVLLDSKKQEQERPTSHAGRVEQSRQAAEVDNEIPF